MLWGHVMKIVGHVMKIVDQYSPEKGPPPRGAARGLLRRAQFVDSLEKIANRLLRRGHAHLLCVVQILSEIRPLSTKTYSFRKAKP